MRALGGATRRRGSRPAAPMSSPTCRRRDCRQIMAKPPWRSDRYVHRLFEETGQTFTSSSRRNAQARLHAAERPAVADGRIGGHRQIPCGFCRTFDVHTGAFRRRFGDTLRTGIRRILADDLKATSGQIDFGSEQRRRRNTASVRLDNRSRPRPSSLRWPEARSLRQSWRDPSRHPRVEFSVHTTQDPSVSPGPDGWQTTSSARPVKSMDRSACGSTRLADRLSSWSLAAKTFAPLSSERRPGSLSGRGFPLSRRIFAVASAFDIFSVKECGASACLGRRTFRSRPIPTLSPLSARSMTTSAR